MGNHVVSKIIGMYDIYITTNLCCKLILKDVKHIVDLRLNLISTGMCDDERYVTHLHNG